MMCAMLHEEVMKAQPYNWQRYAKKFLSEVLTVPGFHGKEAAGRTSALRGAAGGQDSAA